VKKIVAAVLVVAFTTPANAWEAQTTHAGLAEQAAAGSKLHERLVALGFAGGLYEELTVPPKDAPPLLEALSRYSPVQGFVPDQRGRQFAIGWLAAGAVLADSTPAWAVNHFFDPTTGEGASLETSFTERLTAAVRRQLGGSDVPERGRPAPDWIVADAGDNPLGVAGFLDQYAKAVRGASPGERSRAMAGALVAAGAVLHVLQDMGSPSHVRDDLRAHLARLGPARDDLGSRFERVAALAYGRLGVPSAAAIARPTLRAFFTDPDGKGLADLTATSWFSASTLPRPVRLGTGKERDVLPSRLAAALVKPAPALPSRMNLLAAATDDGATLDDAAGVCRARYRVDKGVLRFSSDDDCLLEQIDAILPQVVGYGAGLLDWLFRGELDATRDPGDAGKVIVVARSGLGAGTLEVLTEDARGVRSSAASHSVTAAKAGDPVATVAVPGGAAKVVVLFEGVDDTGAGLVAVGVLSE
jgi:hypothetical protein